MSITALALFAAFNIQPADIPFDSAVTAAEVYPMGTETDPRPILYLYAPGIECSQRPDVKRGAAVAYINNVRFEVDGFDYASRGHVWTVYGRLTCVM